MGPAAPVLRPVAPADAAALRAIYAPYVEDTAISFELSVPSVDEMATRIAATTPALPWLVACRDERIVGYAYAGQHRARAAYRWSVDVSAYVAQSAHRQGIGKALYESLLAEIEALGYANAFAGIALPNAASVGLHEAVGFRPIGVYRQVGFKMGVWHDVGWWQRAFAHPPAPAEPRPWRGS